MFSLAHVSGFLYPHTFHEILKVDPEIPTTRYRNRAMHAQQRYESDVDLSIALGKARLDRWRGNSLVAARFPSLWKKFSPSNLIVFICHLTE